MKIAIAQLNLHVGNFESNTEIILDNIRSAKKSGAKLVVFPELAICGYPPRDFLEFDDFIEKCLSKIDIIAAESKNITVIIGGPSINKTGQGKPLFNSAFILSNGKVQKVINKTLLPTYDVFD